MVGRVLAVRKRLLQEVPAVCALAPGEIDLAGAGTIGHSSEDPEHLVEHLVDGHAGAGSPRWVSARRDVTEHLLFEFVQPQRMSRLAYEVEETDCERTQEVRIEVSQDGGSTFRQILVQDYTFSPRGATLQREDLRFDLNRITHLKVTMVPNKNGSGRATLTSLRMFA